MCTITIISIEKISGQLIVKGTSDSCSQIKIQFTDPYTIEKTAIVSAGIWDVTFSDSSILNFRCGEYSKFAIFCVDGKSCDGPERFIVDCKDPAPICPQIDLQITNISDCNADGKRTVDFEVYSSLNDVIGQIIFGDGDDEDLDFTVYNPYPKSHDYDSGTFNAFVEIQFPRNCPDSEPIEVVIDECEINCPTDITFEIRNLARERFAVIDGELFNISTGLPVDCLEADAYRIEVTSPALESSFTFTWQEDDLPSLNTGNENFFDFKIDDCKAKTIMVLIEKENCPPLLGSIRIEECCEVVKDCVVSDWSGWSECNNNRQRRTRTIISREKYGGKNCPTLFQERECKSPFVFSLCIIAKTLLMVGISLLLVGIVLFLCPAFTMPTIPPPASTILAIALIGTGSGIFLLGLILWLLFCTPDLCDLLVLTWQVLFLAFAAFTYAAFCPACFYLIFGIVFLVLSILLFIVWRNKCKPSICEIYSTLLFLINIGLNIITLMEYVLGWAGCLISSNPIAMHIWLVGVGILNAIVIIGLSRNRCLRE